MHDGLKIAHRDIKPQNIMIDQFDEILLADFGSSKRIHKESLETEGFQEAGDSTSTGFVGTLTHMAPELVEKRKRG